MRFCWWVISFTLYNIFFPSCFLPNLVAFLCIYVGNTSFPFLCSQLHSSPTHQKQFKQAKETHIFERADLLARMGISRDAKYHVLAVDDSLLDRKIIERLLKASSCQVTLVDSGNKALELLGLQDDRRGSQPSSHQEIEVNLIITDYCMPEMTGYDLLKRIKESAYLKDIPVVVMSSENVPSRINRCLEEGAEEFLLKPVKLSDMKKLRPHLLKGKSSSQEHEPNPQDQRQEILNLTEQQQQPQSQSLPKAGKSNKRKVMEGGRISPERTRASYKDYGLTAMV